MLAACRGAAEAAGIDYARLVYPYLQKEMSLATPIALERLCRLAQVSRAGFYRFLQPRHPGEEAMEVRNAIQQIVLEHRRRYGYRRVAFELHRRGMAVNHKRVLRMMREDNLLSVKAKAFIATTQSDHDSEVYLNLAKRMHPTEINQLWVADITYIRLRQEFVYLAVVLDAFSRRIVGWAMGHDLKAQLVLDALNMALTQRRPVAVIHHSDQGSQYTSVAFGLRCKEAGVRPSMGSVGDAYDNAMCESFFATLECELLDRRKFRTKAEARMAVFQFIEGWYNPGRRHSAIGYMSPINYERSTRERLESVSP